METEFSIQIRTAHIRIPKMSCLRFCSTFFLTCSHFLLFYFLSLFFIAPQWVTTESSRTEIFQVKYTSQLMENFVPLRIGIGMIYIYFVILGPNSVRPHLPNSVNKIWKKKIVLCKAQGNCEMINIEFV